MYFIRFGVEFIGRSRIWDRTQLLSREAESDAFISVPSAHDAIDGIQPPTEVGPLGHSPSYVKAMDRFVEKIRRSCCVVCVEPRIVAIKRDRP